MNIALLLEMAAGADGDRLAVGGHRDGLTAGQWGEMVAAVVVLHDGASADAADLADHVVAHLRSSRRPSVVDIRDELPVNDAGKVLRRVLRDEIAMMKVATT